MNEIVPVSARTSFFSSDVKRLELPAGLTYAEIALAVGVPAEFWAEPEDDRAICIGVIQAGGRVIPRKEWETTCPILATENVVTLSVVPGKGLGATGLVGILASVAITGLTLGIGAGFAAPILGASFAAGTFGASALAAGVAIGGSLLLQTLFPPPGAGDNKNRREKPQAGISGNPVIPLEQIPGIRGDVIFSPPLVLSYTELTRGVIYAKGIYAVAGRNAVSDIRINRALADGLDGVEIEIREGDPGDTNLTLVKDTGLETMVSPEQMSEFDLNENDDPLSVLEDQGTPENSYPIWHGFMTRGAGDQIWTRIFFPTGLFQVNSDGDADPAGVPIRGRMRLIGESAWRNLPEFHFQDDRKRARRIQQEIVFIFEADPSGFDDIDGPDNNYNAYIAYAIAGEGEAFEWLADPYFEETGSPTPIFAAHVDRVKDGFRVYLDPAEWPPGTYEVQWMRGLAYDAGTNFDADNYTHNGSASEANFFEHYDDAGTAKVRINQETYTSLTVLEQFTTFFHRYPMANASQLPCPFTFIAIVAKYRTLESVSARFQSKVTKWNGSAWTGVDVSSNPAELYRDVLSGLLNAKPLADAQRDDDNLGAFADWCDDRGYACNYVATGSVMENLQTIAACGFGVPRQREKWGVIWEYDREAESIVQMFSPLNSRMSDAERSFGDLPLALYAEYSDEDDEYKVKSELVYMDEHDASSIGTQIEARSYPGFTNRFLTIERATFDLRQAFYRMSKYPLDIGPESILAGRGELVGFTHDVLDNRVGYAIVKSVTTGGGGNVTGLVLQAPARFADVGGAVSVEIALKDRTSIIKAINETANSATVTFTTPFAPPVDGDTEETLVRGCMLAFGPVGQEKFRCLIDAMQPTPDFGASVMLSKEAQEIHYPARPIDLAAVINEFDQIELSWVQPRQSRTSHANIYRSLTSAFGSATLIDTVTGAFGASKTYADGPAADDWFYWVAAHDNDGHVSDPVRVSITGGYDAATAAYLDAMAVTPDGARQKLIDDLIVGLKADGIFAKLDFLYLHAAHDQQAARLNLIAPATLVITENGTPTWNADQGYTGNGSSMFLDTGFISGVGTLFQQDNACMGFWSNTAGAAAGTSNFDMGADVAGGTRLDIRARTSADLLVFLINSAGGTSVANTDGSGFFCIFRSGAGATRARRNTTLMVSDTDASDGAPAVSIHIMGANGSTSRSARQMAAAWAGANLTNTESDNFYARLNTYMTGL